MDNQLSNIGIVRESRNDENRTPLVPEHIKKYKESNPNINFIIQPSNSRCFSDEEDRVVLSVKLKAFENDNKIFDSSYFLDEKGSGENTAMGKLVSITLSAAIDLIMDNKIESGVKTAPHKTEDIMYFFKILKDYKINIQQENG